MTIAPPAITPVDLSGYPTYHRSFTGVSEFTYTSAMTYTELVDSLRRWIPQVLIPWVETNFEGVDDSIVALGAAVDAALADQATNVNAALADQEAQIPTLAAQAIHDNLQAVLSDEVAFSDPLILAVLTAASSASRDYLDARYLPRAKVNAITGAFHIDGYGASPAAAPAINRAAIQQASVDANAAYVATGARQKVLIPAAVYQVDILPYRWTDGSQHGVTSILLDDGVDFEFHGTVKLAANAYTVGDLAGGYGAIFRNRVRADGIGLSNVSFTGVAGGGIDGNSANNPSPGGGTGVSLINIGAVTDVSVAGMSLTNSSLHGCRITGPTGGTCKNIRYRNNIVKNCVGIGLQCSNFDGLTIFENFVDTTGDNCIDIYGENGSTTSSGTNFIVRSNITRNGATGVFLETVAFGSCHDNIIVNCGTGVRLNRINGEPQDVDIHDCIVQGGITPFYFTGTMRSARLHHCVARGFTGQGVQFGSGSGSTTANIDVDNLTLDGTDATVALYRFSGSTVANVNIARPRSYTVTDPTSANYYVTTAGTTLSNVTKATVIPALDSEAGGASNVASGTVFTVTIPTGKSGTLTIQATSGGAWYSVWTGIVNGGSGRVDVAQLATSGATPGNAILTVAGSTTSQAVTVSLRATGSSMSYKYRIDWAS